MNVANGKVPGFEPERAGSPGRWEAENNDRDGATNFQLRTLWDLRGVDPFPDILRDEFHHGLGA